MSTASRITRIYKTKQMGLRVARQFLARGLDRGRSFQNPKVRIHRYADGIMVTDLTNAGKRGKKVDEMYVTTTYNYKGDKQEWLGRQTAAYLDYINSSNPYAKIKALVKDLMYDFPDDIKLSESQHRGVDIEPYGEIFEFNFPMDDKKSAVKVKSSPTDFHVTDHHWMTRPDGGGFYQDTGYWPRKKKDAVVFYGWMKDNASKLKSFKSMQDYRDLWKKLGVDYDFH